MSQPQPEYVTPKVSFQLADRLVVLSKEIIRKPAGFSQQFGGVDLSEIEQCFSEVKQYCLYFMIYQILLPQGRQIVAEDLFDPRNHLFV